MLDLGLQKSRPPPRPPHPGLRALVVAAVGALAVIAALALAGLDLASRRPGPTRRDLFGRRIVSPLAAAAGGLLALGGLGAVLGGRAVQRQRRARHALREWAARRGFEVETGDEVACDAGRNAGVRVRILYRVAGLGDASGLLVSLPSGWLSDVCLFAGSSDAIVKRIDGLLADARQREG